jgi:hypothetical protein
MTRTLASLAAATFLLTAAAAPAAADEVVATTATGDATATASAKAAPVSPRSGQVIRDASGRRLGAIDSIRGANAVVIMDMHMYNIPISTLSAGEKGLQTTLLRSQLH